MLVVDYIITAISLAPIVYLELKRCLHELINDSCRKLNDCQSFPDIQKRQRNSTAIAHVHGIDRNYGKLLCGSIFRALKKSAELIHARWIENEQN